MVFNGETMGDVVTKCLHDCIARVSALRQNCARCTKISTSQHSRATSINNQWTEHQSMDSDSIFVIQLDWFHCIYRSESVRIYVKLKVFARIPRRKHNTMVYIDQNPLFFRACHDGSTIRLHPSGDECTCLMKRFGSRISNIFVINVFDSSYSVIGDVPKTGPLITMYVICRATGSTCVARWRGQRITGSRSEWVWRRCDGCGVIAHGPVGPCVYFCGFGWPGRVAHFYTTIDYVHKFQFRIQLFII